MKLYHYAMLFLCFAISMMSVVELKTIHGNDADRMKHSVEKVIERSIMAAAGTLACEGGAENELARENAIEALFDSIDAGFGILNDPVSQAILRSRVKAVAIVGADELYLYQGELTEAERLTIMSVAENNSMIVIWQDINVDDGLAFCDMYIISGAYYQSKYRIISNIC